MSYRQLSDVAEMPDQAASRIFTRIPALAQRPTR